MAINSTGPLKFSDLQTEFGGTAPIGLSEYYAGGSFVSPGTSGNSGAIPSSGNALNIGKFYGSAAAGLVWGSRFLRAQGFYVSEGYIRYLNGKFFILGAGGSSTGSYGNSSAITYSTDSTATTWLTTSVGEGPHYGPLGTSAAYLTTPKVNDIATNGTLYVAAGSSLGRAVGSNLFPNGILATSTDLVNWTVLTAASLPTSMLHVNRIIWSPERSLFVAVGGLGYASAGTSNNVFTSPDGINWTARALPGRPDGNTNPIINSVYWNGFVFVVTGDNVVAYSSDGITWINSNGYGAPGYTFKYNEISFGNSTFVITSENSPQAVWTSPNGITWTQRTLPTYIGGTIGVTYGTNGFVVVNANSGEITTSPDGITWTFRGGFLRNGGYSGSGLGTPIRNITFGASKYIGIGQGSVASSVDGFNWTSLSSGSVADLNSVASSGSITVAVGPSDYNAFSRTTRVPTILKSTDGNFWSLSNTVGLSSVADFSLYDVLWTGTRFVAVGGSGPFGSSNLIITSSDGTTWTTQVNTISTASTITSVAQKGNTLITNTKLRSTDGGLTWASDTASYGGDFITASPNLFVIVYKNNRPGVSLIYYTSPDGITWTQRTFAFTKDVYVNRIRWVNDRFIICGSTTVSITTPSGSISQQIRGTLFYSTDPTIPSTWTESPLNYQNNTYQPSPFLDVCYGFGKYYAVGGINSGILSSTNGVNFSEVKNVSDNTLNAYSAKKLGHGFQALNSITKSNNKLIAVGALGNVATSPAPTSTTL